MIGRGRLKKLRLNRRRGFRSLRHPALRLDVRSHQSPRSRYRVRRRARLDLRDGRLCVVRAVLDERKMSPSPIPFLRRDLCGRVLGRLEAVRVLVFVLVLGLFLREVLDRLLERE